MTVIERFLKYVTFDTQSDESTGVTPFSITYRFCVLR